MRPGQFSLSQEAIELALERAGYAEIAGGGPEDPAADVAAAVAIIGTIIIASDPLPTPAADPGKPDRDAYHRACDEPPPPGLSPCDLIKWKIARARSCIQMRQDYITKWKDTYPGHPAQIAQRQRELAKLESELKEKCCGNP